MPRNLDLYVDQGVSFTTTFTLTDSSGDILDFTGYTAFGHMARSYYNYFNPANVIELDISIQSPPTNGVIQLSFAATDTAEYVPDDYYYSISMNDGTGNITRVVQGILQVRPDVTFYVEPPLAETNWQNQLSNSVIID